MNVQNFNFARVVPKTKFLTSNFDIQNNKIASDSATGWHCAL